MSGRHAKPTTLAPFSWTDQAENVAARLRYEAELYGNASYTAALHGAAALEHHAAFARAVLALPVRVDSAGNRLLYAADIGALAAEHLGES